MKLTNSHRSAFVRAVMQDVPTIDYQDQVEKILVADMVEQAKSISPALVTLLKNPKLRHYAIDRYNTITFYNMGLSSVGAYAGYKKSMKVDEALQPVLAAAKEQIAGRSALHAKLTATIAACSTLKMALEALPEFSKYLPVEEVKTTMLPAIANLIVDLTRAGWKQPEAVSS